MGGKYGIDFGFDKLGYLPACSSGKSVRVGNFVQSVPNNFKCFVATDSTKKVVIFSLSLIHISLLKKSPVVCINNIFVPGAASDMDKFCSKLFSEAERRCV